MVPARTTNLMIEKNFRRLLTSAEKSVDENSIEDWKLNQFTQSLIGMLNEMQKMGNSKQLDEYRERVDQLRQHIDPVKLDDQTFPRQRQQQKEEEEKRQQKQKEQRANVVPVKTSTNESSSTNEQFIQPTTSHHETNLSYPSKSPRLHSNRNQQLIESEEKKQDRTAESMIMVTQNIHKTAQRMNDIVKSDQKKIARAENLIDKNMLKLRVESKRLKYNAYNASNCWIYVMLIVVIVTFIYLTLFMRMFRKRTIIPTSQSSLGTKSLLDNSINQTSINQSNGTAITTKSTDYISLLLNYANENHTDF